MAKYKLIVLSNPTEGNEEEYNRWYDEQHVPDVCNVPGFVSAERFELHGDGTHNYLAIYNIETDDVDAAMADLGSRAGTDKMPMTPAIDVDNVSMSIFKARD